MAHAQDVAAHMLRRAGPMPATKLHALLYYAQCWCLVTQDRPLFDEKIRADATGPMVDGIPRTGTIGLEDLVRECPDTLIS